MENPRLILDDKANFRNIGPSLPIRSERLRIWRKADCAYHVFVNEKDKLSAEECTFGRECPLRLDVHWESQDKAEEMIEELKRLRKIKLESPIADVKGARLFRNLDDIYS